MNDLIERLIEKQDELVREMDLKKSLRTVAAAGLIGGASIYGLNKLASTPSEQPVKSAKVVQVDKGAEDIRGVEASLKEYFPKEYNTIKAAADRNDCKGEDLVILFALRKIENGRPGLEFGIMHPRAKNTDLDTQAGWAAATIVKNRQRWDGKGDFIEFLGSRYAPIGVKNDPKGLNKNWVRNVRYWKEKLEK